MKVLSIDPGFDRLGIAILEKNNGKEEVLYSECLKATKGIERESQILIIGNRIREVIDEWKPSDLAIETLFFNQNITSALGVAEARGVVIYEAMRAGLKIFEYSPQAIKIAVTGHGKADKRSVEAMVLRLVELPKKDATLDDEVDAIALGITHLASRKGF